MPPTSTLTRKIKLPGTEIIRKTRLPNLSLERQLPRKSHFAKKEVMLEYDITDIERKMKFKSTGDRTFRRETAERAMSRFEQSKIFEFHEGSEEFTKVSKGEKMLAHS